MTILKNRTLHWNGELVFECPNWNDLLDFFDTLNEKREKCIISTNKNIVKIIIQLSVEKMWIFPNMKIFG